MLETLVDRWSSWVPPALRLLGARRRRVALTGGRAHVELRGLPAELEDVFTARLRATLAALGGVEWVAVNLALGRAVVAFDPAVRSADAIAAAVELVERACGVTEEGFPPRPDHPADLEPLVRAGVEIAADLAGFWLAVAGKVTGLRVAALEVDALAALSLFEGVPRLRALVDDVIGTEATDLALTVARALAQGLVQTPLGPLVDAAQRVVAIAEIQARRDAWSAVEAAFDGPDVHGAPALDVARLRPEPLPAGPIERYADVAVPGSVGAFGMATAATGSLAAASASIFGGLPRPALLGREVFAACAGRTLAAHGIVALDPRALRCLDRIDTVVIDRRVLPHGDGAVWDGLRDAAEGSRLRLLVTGASADAAALGAAGALPEAELAGRIRALQRQGHGVAVVTAHDGAALIAADCGIGVAGTPIPWDAHLLCTGGPERVALVLSACGIARTVAEQGVSLSELGSASGLALAFAGLRWSTTARILGAVNLAAVAAMANAARLAWSLDELPGPAPRDRTPWHRMTIADVLATLRTSERGLASVEAASRRLPPRPTAASGPLLGALRAQLSGPLAPVLGIGAALAAAVGSTVDAALILGVAGLNAAIGARQQVQTERALSAIIDGGGAAGARVLRDGTPTIVPPDALVPGDVVLLQTQDVVPADCRVLEATGLEIDESSLTGESFPVPKGPEPSDAALVAERRDMLHAGTVVAAGRGRGVVVAVGAEVEARRGVDTAASVRTSGGVEERLRDLVGTTAPLALGSGALVAAVGLLRGRPLAEILSAGVGLAVAAVPEGLPLVANVAQLGAAGRLAARGVLVRTPRAVEALGRVDTLCLDKTGTLTAGAITLAAVSTGERTCAAGDLDPAARAVLAAALRATPGALSGREPEHVTDRALLAGAAAARVAPDEGAAGWRKDSELPFETARGFHACHGRTAAGALLSVKGAPETVLAQCTRRRTDAGEVALDGAGRAALARTVTRLGDEGYRVLAVAERPSGNGPAIDEARVADLTFRGFVAFADPVRPTAAAAVAAVRSAGVRVLMLTGDHASTAAAIARTLGLADGAAVLTGSEMDALGDAALERRLRDAAVVARVTPAQKVRIVRALQRTGAVVAMTGDGANDAAAIRLADAGIAVGAHATPAAREAADLVVTDDRIETLVHALLEGRALWRSVRDAVSILVGGNLGEIGFILAGGLLAGRSPLSARQLLLVNLLTDVGPAMVIARRPPPGASAEALLHEGPETSLGRALDRDIAWRAVVTAGSAGAAWLLARPLGTSRRASTVALVSLVGAQLGQTLVRGERDWAVTATALGSFAVLAALVQTPGVSGFFDCRPLGPLGWATALGSTAAATASAAIAPRVVTAIDAWADGAAPWTRIADVVDRLVRPGAGTRGD